MIKIVETIESILRQAYHDRDFLSMGIKKRQRRKYRREKPILDKGKEIYAEQDVRGKESMGKIKKAKVNYRDDIKDGIPKIRVSRVGQERSSKKGNNLIRIKQVVIIKEQKKAANITQLRKKVSILVS